MNLKRSYSDSILAKKERSVTSKTLKINLGLQERYALLETVIKLCGRYAKGRTNFAKFPRFNRELQMAVEKRDHHCAGLTQKLCEFFPFGLQA